MGLVLVEAILLTDKPKAILIHKDGVDIWLPRSQIPYLSKDSEGGIKIHIPDWLAKQKQLDYEDLP